MLGQENTLEAIPPDPHTRAVRLCMTYIYGVEGCVCIPDLGETCVALRALER